MSKLTNQGISDSHQEPGLGTRSKRPCCAMVEVGIPPIPKAGETFRDMVERVSRLKVAAIRISERRATCHSFEDPRHGIFDIHWIGTYSATARYVRTRSAEWYRCIARRNVA